jgi:hypothetical protein
VATRPVATKPSPPAVSVSGSSIGAASAPLGLGNK